MQCIKTGFSIYIRSIDKYSRMDLFYDGVHLYSNNNDLYEGFPKGMEFDIICADIIPQGYYNQLILPEVSQSVIDYVYTMPYKGIYEDKFLEVYKP